LGYKELAMGLLGKFSWGHTFYELNEYLLGDYANVLSEEEIGPLLREYGLIRNID
jgi:pre-rRNA-processing protein TSR3